MRGLVNRFGVEEGIKWRNFKLLFPCRVWFPSLCKANGPVR